MKLIELTEDLLTGVEEMDNQHREIVNLINKMADYLAQDKFQEAVEIYKKELIPFVNYHLTQEENFMASINYPDLEDHKRHHSWVLELFTKLGESMEDKKSARQALAVITGWLYGHVGKVDKKYGVFLSLKVTG